MSTQTLSIPISSDDNVLLAIADDVSADLIEHRMSRQGLDPVRATDGGETRSKLRRTRFDLVVIQSRLSGLTGLELLRRVPTEDVLGTPSVVLLGQSGNDEEVVRAFELGAAEYISRPFAPKVALARLLRFLRTGTDQISHASLGLLPVPVSDAVDPLSLMIGGTALLLLLAVFFAAIAGILHVHTRLQERRREQVTATWKTILLDVLAGDADPQSLLDQVSPAQERAFLKFLVPYAFRVKGRALHLIRKIAIPAQSQLEEDLDRPQPGHRAQAVQLFGLLGDASCRGLLRRSLDDPSPLVAYTAFRWLCRRGTPEDLDLLLDHLDTLAHVNRSQLSSWLLQLGADAAPGLREYLRDSEQTTFVRVVCAETLRWMGDGDAAALATQLLAGEPPPELAAALLRLLRRVGGPNQAFLVRSYCASDVHFVQIHAARALGQIGHPDLDQSLLHDLVAGADSRWVALNAAKSLTELDQTAPLRRLSRSSHDRAPLAESILAEPQ